MWVATFEYEKKQMKIETERSIEMTTKEVAQICGVTDECIRQNAKVMGVELGDRWHPHEWTDEEMKKLQVMLMKNQVSQGSTDSESTVRKVTQTALGEGLAINVLSNSGDVEAMREYCEMLIQKTQAQHELLLAQKQNQLLLEQKEEAEKETERIYQVNKNFHNNLYTASQIAKKLGITANMVGRIANEHGLKQDPIYGKLGKIQLNNGQWVNQFYYNDDALTVIEAVIG